MDGKNAAYVFLHSRETPPRPCPSIVWVGTGAADHVVYDDRLHRIDLCGKVEKNWREEHGPYILSWDMRQQQLCHAPSQTGEMPHQSANFIKNMPRTTTLECPGFPSLRALTFDVLGLIIGEFFSHTLL